MISEVYACGRNVVSSFVVVEEGEVVHFGSHKWGSTVSFDGVEVEVSDVECEVLAVICGIMLVRRRGRMLVNIYTDRDDCQKRYNGIQHGQTVLRSESAFADVLAEKCKGLDVYAVKWLDEVCQDRVYVRNVFAWKCWQMTKV